MGTAKGVSIGTGAAAVTWLWRITSNTMADLAVDCGLADRFRATQAPMAAWASIEISSANKGEGCAADFPLDSPAKSASIG